MVALIALALSVGIVDSINPSTVGPALYLATGANAVRSLALFIVGVFGVYAACGIALALGAGQFIPHPDEHRLHLLETGFGAGALILAAVLWMVRDRVAAHLERHGGIGERAPLLLGAGIMVVELPTAFPYFAVIAAVGGSGRSAATQIGLVLLFNLAFVVPLLAILLLRGLASGRSRETLTSWRRRIDRQGAVLAPVLVLAIGFALLVLGISGLT